MVAGFSLRTSKLKIGKFLKFKLLRPNAIEILNYQINNNFINVSNSQKGWEKEALALESKSAWFKLRSLPSLALAGRGETGGCRPTLTEKARMDTIGQTYMSFIH